MAGNPDVGSVPTQSELMNPTLRALHALGGSASVGEITNRVIEDMSLPPHITQIPHGRGRQSKLKFNLGWARTCLKNYGLLDNSGGGVWSLTASGLRTECVDPRDVVRAYRQRSGAERDRRDGDGPTEESPDVAAPASEKPSADEPSLSEDSSDETASWRETLSAALLNMSPDAFERLCQRLLRESGFIEVTVTGRSGDGGIDGRGIIRLAGLISFPVVFQCKRYTNNVSAGTVRDFRGAMAGRADRGLILTTGGFTGDAEKEATRDGVPPIDLIDGELLMDRLKELGLGVSVKTVEVVEVDKKWFDSI